MRPGLVLSLMLLAPAVQAGEACKIQPLGWSKDNRLFAYEAQRSYAGGAKEPLRVTVGVVVNAYSNNIDTTVLEASATGSRLKDHHLQDPNPGAFSAWKAQANLQGVAAGVRGRVARATVRLGNGTGAWKNEAFEFSGHDDHAVEVTPTVVAGDSQSAVDTWTLPHRKHGAENTEAAQLSVEGDLRAFFSPDGARVAWLLCVHGDEGAPPEDSMRIGSAVPLEDAPAGPDKCNTRVPQAFPPIGKSLAAAAKLRSQLRDPHASFGATVEQAYALRTQFAKGEENLTEILCSSDSQISVQPCLDPIEVDCETGTLRIQWAHWLDVPKSPEEAQAYVAADAVLDGPKDLFHTCCAGKTCATGGVAVPDGWIDTERLNAQVMLAAGDGKFGDAMLETWKRSAKGLQKATCSCDNNSKKDLTSFAARLEEASKAVPAGAHKQTLQGLLGGVAKTLRHGLPKTRCDVGAGGG